jgi:lysophospholipase L1-like esterase
MPTVHCLGDSITENGAPPYATTLGAALGAGYAVTNDGHSGYTTGDILTHVWPSVRALSPALITVLAGVNDQFRTSYYGGVSSGPPLSSATSIANLTAVYDQQRADGRGLILVTVLPYGGYSGWTAQGQTNIDAINTAVRAYGAAHAVPVFDGYAFFGASDNPQVLAAAWGSTDGLHPGQAGANAIAAQLAAIIQGPIAADRSDSASLGASQGAAYQPAGRLTVAAGPVVGGKVTLSGHRIPGSVVYVSR